MNFRRLISGASMVLTTLLMLAQGIQSLVRMASEREEAKEAQKTQKARKPGRRLPPKR
jgi:hypothetical protein